MCMLTKRTQILFDDELWEKLVSLAGEKKTSIGNLVREAVEEKYTQEARFAKRRKVFENILRHRPLPVKGIINYKALINVGRKNF